MKSDFVIVVRTWQTVFFLTMQCCRNTAALMKCKIIGLQSFKNVCFGQAAHTCFRTRSFHYTVPSTKVAHAEQSMCRSKSMR